MNFDEVTEEEENLSKWKFIQEKINMSKPKFPLKQLIQQHWNNEKLFRKSLALPTRGCILSFHPWNSSKKTAFY
jgi:hypothetical protein